MSKLNVLAQELEDQKRKNETLQNDLKKAMTLLKEAGAVNLNKDFHINELNKKLQNAQFEQNQPKNDSLFSSFVRHFTHQQLKKLRSITSGQAKDSTFVLTCMRFLYPNRNALNNKSVDGQKYKGKKQAMTPQKVKMISDMLSERLNSENGLDSISALKRFERVKKLIKNAINKLKVKSGLVEDTPKLARDANQLNSFDVQTANSYTISPACSYTVHTENPFAFQSNPYAFQQSNQYAFLSAPSKE